MFGVFLRLYHPDLPELKADWRLREHAEDAAFLRSWYGVARDFLDGRPELRDGYGHVTGGLWPAALPETGVRDESPA